MTHFIAGHLASVFNDIHPKLNYKSRTAIVKDGDDGISRVVIVDSHKRQVAIYVDKGCLIEYMLGFLSPVLLDISQAIYRITPR